MNKRTTTPSEDGFYMPAEYAHHKGCVLIWPVRPGSWPHEAKEAQQTFTLLAKAIAESEKVWMLAGEADYLQVKEIFKEDINIDVLQVETDDAWARDVGPTCVINEQG